MGIAILDRAAKPSTTSAIISYSADEWYYPEDGGSTIDSYTSGNSTYVVTTTIEYSDMIWSWSFSDGSSSSNQSGTKTFYGLNVGTKNTIRGTVSVECTMTKTVLTEITTTTTDAEGNPMEEYDTIGPDTSTSTIDLGSASDSVPVYTKPYSFSFGCSSGDFISDYLTISNWNKLCTQVGEYSSWDLQSSNYDVADGLKLSTKEWITANLYNAMAEKCGTDRRVVAGKDLIYASYFEELAAAVS